MEQHLNREMGSKEKDSDWISMGKQQRLGVDKNHLVERIR